MIDLSVCCIGAVVRCPVCDVFDVCTLLALSICVAVVPRLAYCYGTIADFSTSAFCARVGCHGVDAQHVRARLAGVGCSRCYLISPFAALADSRISCISACVCCTVGNMPFVEPCARRARVCNAGGAGVVSVKEARGTSGNACIVPGAASCSLSSTARLLGASWGASVDSD